MAVFTTFAEWRTDVLGRAGQATDSTSGVYTLAANLLVRAYHQVCNTYPFLFLRVAPPAAFNTVASFTTGTVLATNGQTAITFSSAPAASVANREILISGAQEAYRIATHVAGAAGAVLDTAFNGTTGAALTYTVFQREYDLVTGLRHIESMIVAETGAMIEQREERAMWIDAPDPPKLMWPPQQFARIGEQRIRFDGYPDRTRRIEYAYTQIPADPDGDAVTILIPRNWRYVPIDGALYWLFLRLVDSRADAAGITFQNGIDQMIADDARKRSNLGISYPKPSVYA